MWCPQPRFQGAGCSAARGSSTTTTGRTVPWGVGLWRSAQPGGIAAGSEHVLMLSGSTTTSLRAFAQAAFAVADLDLADHLESVEAQPHRSPARLGGQPFGSGDRGENGSGGVVAVLFLVLS